MYVIINILLLLLLLLCFKPFCAQEFAKKISSEVEILDGMELVEQPSDHDSYCYCHRTKQVDKSTLLPFADRHVYTITICR